MDKLQEKYAKLAQASARLEEGISDYDLHPADTMRDGVIQRFEFCAELAWKTIREYLQGYQTPGSPKGVMRQAYADGLISEEQGWIALLDVRNLTSHLYDEATARKIFQDIREIYVPLLRKLVQDLSEQGLSPVPNTDAFPQNH